MRRNAISTIGCASKPSVMSTGRHNHHSDRTTKAASSATTTDLATSFGVAQVRDRTRIQIRTIAGIQGQHARAFPLATTTQWTLWPPFVRPRRKKIKKNTTRPVDVSSVVSKVTSRGLARVRNCVKTRMPALSPSKMMYRMICPSTAVAIRASHPPRLPRSQCASPTRKKEHSPASFKRWEPMWVFRMPEHLGSCSGYRYRLCVFC